eukprot:gene357-10020_t
MGLKPLEFSDCYLDSPYFRDNVNEHEKELERTGEQIKGLIKECKVLLKAVDNLSKAQRSFCNVLKHFTLNYIGEIDTPDEIEIADAFNNFSTLIERVEEERERMLEHAHIQLIAPLEKFRKSQIGSAKEEKKKYEDETRKLCALQDKHLQLKNKTKDEILKESDQQMGTEFKNFQHLAFDYVSKLQEVNETKKFELVEILRERYSVTSEEAEDLKRKVEKQGESGELQKGMCARQGYLYVQEKKHGGLVSAWTKYYCTYQKENKILTMIPYVQTMGKMNTVTDTMVVKSCERKPTEPPERRFCFEITAMERKEALSLQALSDEDRRCWLDVMDGVEPIYLQSANLINNADMISDIGNIFIRKCIAAIEKKSLEEEGLYRIAGVSSKFNNLVKLAIDSKKAPILDLESDQSEFDLRTITSALKQYLRTLEEPLLTFRLHLDFLEAIKLPEQEQRIEALRDCCCKLPEVNFSTLKLLMEHLANVAAHSNKNLMQPSNIGVVWGPTLMRPREETMAAIMNLKFQGVVIETLIKEYDKIFSDDAGRKPKPEVSKPEVSKPEVSKPEVSKPEGPNNELMKPDLKAEPRRSPNLPRKHHNGPIGISNPGYMDVRPPVLQKPVHSQKSYPAPPPPQNKPLLPKKNLSKPDLDSDSWTIISDRSSGYSTCSSVGEELQRTVSTPALNTSSEAASSSSVSSRRGTQGGKPLPPPKRIFESVPAFTSVPAAEDAERDQEYENVRATVPKRTISFEKAVQNRQVAMVGPLQKSTLPEDGKEPISPPPIPRRKDWKVIALYNCVAENDAELSFGMGAIITNVRKSPEEGWLTGTLNGRTGLIPVNYVETVDEI